VAAIEDFGGVVVAGAGPVGLFTALKLARNGVPVVVLEAESEISKSPRALGHRWPIPKALASISILEDAKKVGIMAHVNQYRTLAGDINRMPMALLDTEQEQPYDLLLGQDVLAEIIVDHLSRLPSSAVRRRHRVTDIVQDADTVTVLVDAQGEPRTLRAPWLIAADGARSTVRNALNLAFDGFTWPERFVATNVYYDFKAHGFDSANFLSDPVNWAIIIQINHQGLWRVAYGEDADISEDEVRRRVGDHYAAIMPGREKWELANIGSYRVHERCAASFRLGRVLLVGDAAHICNPIGGLGLAGGIVDAVALTNALLRVLNGDADDAIFDQYSTERRRTFLEFTSPTVSENKRRLSEQDPERRKRNLAGLRHVCADPELTRKALRLPSGLVSDLAKELLS
jgi:2-polyprenyl-6-methoxyphenol hydroxylase-like FAD-dependent oxidoreductase